MNNYLLNRRFIMLCIFLCTLIAGGSMKSFAQTGERRVTGTVTDETGDPLIGVNILATGTTTGSITDFDGNYVITLPAGSNITDDASLAPGTYTLTIDLIGGTYEFE